MTNWSFKKKPIQAVSYKQVHLKRLDSSTLMLNGELLYVSKKSNTYWVHWKGRSYCLQHIPKTWDQKNHLQTGLDICAPLTGTVKEVFVQKGQNVVAGEKLLILEAMKMEYRVDAHQDGYIDVVHCSIKDIVQADQVLVSMKDE